MKNVMRRKGLLKSRTAVLLAIVLAGTMLSACGTSGANEKSSVEASKTEAATETEPSSEPASAADGNAETKESSGAETKTAGETEAGQGSVSLEYNSGGDTPTTATVIFHPDQGTVEVSALASSMYELSYETTYSVADGQLTIETAAGLEATDISGVAKVIGLPEIMPGTAIHTVSDNGGKVMLTIRFGDPAKLDEAALLGEIELDEDVMAQLGA